MLPHDVTAAILEEWNKERAAMLEEWNILLGIELHFYANSSFCFSMQILLLVTWAKTPYKRRLISTIIVQISWETKADDTRFNILQHLLLTNVEQCCTNVLNGIELVSIFVQHRSTTFNLLNCIFQHSTWPDTLFIICWTRAATFVDQKMLNRVSSALGRVRLTAGIPE